MTTFLCFECDQPALPGEVLCATHHPKFAPACTSKGRAQALRAGAQYDYTTREALEREPSRRARWWRVKVIVYRPDLDKAWVEMAESGRHRVIDAAPFVFKRVESL